MANELEPIDAPRYRAGIDDAVIVPLVVIGYIAKTLLRWTWKLLVFIVDHIFPILLQVARFLLFTFRIIGDGVTALLRFIIRLLPLPGDKRSKWREAVSRAWSWLRRKISYRVFEEYIHHLFEDGMAWVFRICRKLSPGGALLVILASLVWIPVSFIAATAAHAFLIAEAASLPSWMQVFHAVAAILAKSKLLMLPAYPAAWPQAKKHPVVQAGARAYRHIAALRVVKKLRHRFHQTELVAADMARGMDRFAARIGLVRLFAWLGRRIGGGAVRFGSAARRLWRRTIRRLVRVPLLGPVLRSYETHYDDRGAAPSKRISQRIKEFFQRWEIKFTPAYYEAKALAEAARHAVPAAAVAVPGAVPAAVSTIPAPVPAAPLTAAPPPHPREPGTG